MKRFKQMLSMALSSAMLLTTLVGCASGGDSGGTTTPSTDTTTPSTSNTSSEGDILIGLLGNTTGEYAQYGIAVNNGAKLYIEEINAAGGVNGKQITVSEYDDKGDPTDAITLFKRLEEEGVNAIIGSVLSGTSIALADETYDANMPQITASGTAAGVTIMEDTGEVRTNVFRACFIDPFQGEKMATYAKEKLGATTAAVIYQTGADYSVGLKDAFEETCAALGIEVVASEGYATGDKAFQAQLTTIASKAPDVIFAPNYYEDIGLIVTQAREQSITSTFLGGDGWAGVKDYASAEDLEGSVFCSGFAGNPDFEATYLARYTDTSSVGMFEALGYDAAMVLVEAIKVAEDSGIATGTDDYKQAIIDAMKATDGLEGLTGSFAFDENNDPIKSASMMILAGGSEVFSEQF